MSRRADRPCVAFVHAHPDDEAIFTGGTIARLVARGHHVVVIVATSGEQGRDAGGGDLADRRERETLIACERLGVTTVEFLRYGDSGVHADEHSIPAASFAAADSTAAAQSVAEILIRESADCVVGYDDNGIYGHPDHVQVHTVTRIAARLAGTPTLYEATVDREYLHFVTTHLVETAYLAVPTSAQLGVPSVLVNTQVDIRGELAAKRDAIAAHDSQIPGDSSIRAMPDALFAEVYGYEWYLREGPPGPLELLDTADSPDQFPLVDQCQASDGRL